MCACTPTVNLCFSTDVSLPRASHYCGLKSSQMPPINPPLYLYRAFQNGGAHSTSILSPQMRKAAFRSKLEKQIVMTHSLPSSLRNLFSKFILSCPGPALPSRCIWEDQGAHKSWKTVEAASLCLSLESPRPAASWKRKGAVPPLLCPDSSLPGPHTINPPTLPQFSLVASMEKK